MNHLQIATVCDLEKAFNSVDQTLLLSKLINSGLREVKYWAYGLCEI